ncbi:GNAT family N-acetyltransferase [Dyadobacter chenhuakuii]|uniref:GNAT family N-acetyltransferase n=1 Tax=Dyadobacter chenhuakuii TaxID=2909339 RepID=A0A9X1TVN7_9BACT|nr:GNAT family N-acetyltransferase [Dyadobacter chenhuakuii]MCF2500603.1 GNAT family N-acetyltransferase [Dyadobacter chenhuakuii]
MNPAEYHLDNHYQDPNNGDANSAIKIIDYNPAHAKAFYDLNYAWISEAYEVEPEDEKVLDDPENYYLKDGGAILIALYQNEVVGTCALKQGESGTLEMSKMTVSKEMRGKKIGDLLGNAIIEKARDLGAQKIILYSNKKGSAAGINLYRKLGFVEVPLTGHNFKRADIKMELAL